MKKVFLFIIFIILQIGLFAASRYWIGGGTNTNWNASPTTNWSATSGGTVRVAAPTSSDDVIFDGAGTNGNTVSVCNAGSCLSLTFTSGYTSTITLSANLTIAGNFTDNTAHTWVYSSGSMTINAASTIISGGKTFPGPVTFSGAGTKTLSTNDWTITGVLTSSTTTTLNGQTLNCAGLTATGIIGGTTLINLTGGTWSGAAAVQSNLTFAGNVTVSGSVVYNTGTITYSSGTITTTGSTVTCNSATTWNTNGITWANINFAGTQTLNSLLTLAGTLSLSGSFTTFAGTAGWTTATFSSTATNAQTYTFQHGNTYTITTSFQAFQSRTGSIILFTSDDATLTAAIVLQSGAICSVLADFRRIDATGGRTINTFHGTLTTTTNIFSYTDFGGSGSTSSYLFCN